MYSVKFFGRRYRFKTGERRLSAFNEAMILIELYCLVGFSELAPELAKQTIASILLTAINITIALNIGYMTWTIAQKVEVTERRKALMQRFWAHQTMQARQYSEKNGVAVDIQRKRKVDQMDKFDVNIFANKEQSTETLRYSYIEQLSAIPEQPENEEDEPTVLASIN